MKRWILGGAIALAIATGARNSHAGQREDVAHAWAPILLQEADDPVKDLLTAFDFDGDWNGDNNAENMECWSDASKCNTSDNPSSPCTGQKCPLIATVYFTVIETATHWFVQYMPYHPLDWKLTNGHENDTESVLITVRKDGSPHGKIETMETRFHLYWYQYAADSTITDGADNVDGPIHFDATSGRPMVHVQMVGHGFCGGMATRIDAFPDLQLTCNHDQVPAIQEYGVIYSPDAPATMPVVVSGSTVNNGYNLVELYTSVWPHIHEIGPGKAFLSAMDFTGERCTTAFVCPKQFGGDWEGNEGQSPGEPWAQEGGNGVSATGDQFFDPAYTMSKRFTFPAPFSLDYCENPYVGITAGCPDDADAGSMSDAGSGAPGSSGSSGSSGSGSVGAPDGGAATTNSGDPSTPTAAANGCGCRTTGTKSRDALAWLGIGALLLIAARRAKSRA